MTKELIRCLTAVFRQKGKDLLTEQEFVYAVSMDFHWFPPKDAQYLLDVAIKEGLLKLSHGMLSPNFELADQNLGMEYRPSENLLKSHAKPEKTDLFIQIVNKIIAGTKLSKKEVVGRINKTRERMGIDIEVAALVVARGLGIDINEEIPAAEQELLSRSA